jgi:hypothetical protein
MGALTGVAEIIRERRRQIECKGYTPEHDRREHADGRLANLAAAEVVSLISQRINGLSDPGTDQTSLAETGAMAAAEIDRLQAEFGQPEPATYRCWSTGGGPGENGVIHHVHGPDQPCPLYGNQP